VSQSSTSLIIIGLVRLREATYSPNARAKRALFHHPFCSLQALLAIALEIRTWLAG